jgi:hypothetical protein
MRSSTRIVERRTPAAASSRCARWPRSWPASLSWASEGLLRAFRAASPGPASVLPAAPRASSSAWLPRPRGRRTSSARCGRWRRYPVPAADLGHRQPRLVLLQHADDLFLPEPALAHRPSASVTDPGSNRGTPGSKVPCTRARTARRSNWRARSCGWRRWGLDAERAPWGGGLFGEGGCGGPQPPTVEISTPV